MANGVKAAESKNCPRGNGISHDSPLKDHESITACAICLIVVAHFILQIERNVGKARSYHARENKLGKTKNSGSSIDVLCKREQN